MYLVEHVQLRDLFELAGLAQAYKEVTFRRQRYPMIFIS